MNQFSQLDSPFERRDRIDWVRLRTLIALRWLAVCGQTIAVLVARFGLEIDLRIDLCALVIAALAVFNLVSMATQPANKRLGQSSVMVSLIFDVAQLVLLLFLTGGLSNPFSLLVLAPVTISATALTLSSTLLIGTLTVMAISVLVFFHLPLTLMDGTIVSPPVLLIAGMWASLIIGIVFLSGYARRVTVDSLSMSEALSATQMALAREQRLTALGGVVAAAAHELGTPLATIKLVSGELKDELQERPELLEDITLIQSQTERCRDILRDMGKIGRDDSLMRYAPFTTVVSEAAEPHLERGKRVFLRVDGHPFESEPSDQPLIHRYPEVIHGLRNLVQNSVDFATSTVWVDMSWDDTTIRLSVGDDGNGFPNEIIGQLGDPFVKRRSKLSPGQNSRPEYEGMGLGLFIAKTLLGRTGAQIKFLNGRRPFIQSKERNKLDLKTAAPNGAIVQVVWERSEIEADTSTTREPLGRNELNLP